MRVKLKTMPPPEFGTMTTNEFILYQSTLTPTGSRYSKLARYPVALKSALQDNLGHCIFIVAIPSFLLGSIPFGYLLVAFSASGTFADTAAGTSAPRM